MNKLTCSTSLHGQQPKNWNEQENENRFHVNFKQSDWCSILRHESVYNYRNAFFFSRRTESNSSFLSQLFRLWRMHSTQNTFKGLENEATFSWNGLLPTLIVKEKTKINLLLNLLQLTLSHLFKSRIRFRREQYRNPVLNSATYPRIWHFPNRNKMFLCLNFCFFFFPTSSFTV